MNVSEYRSRATPSPPCRSTIDAERTIDCPFSFALDEAHALFKSLETAGATVPLRRLGLPLRGTLRRQVVVAVSRRRDRLEWGRIHDEIAFVWSSRSIWIPDLEGVLRFRIETLRTRALVHGEYVPPFGTFGRSFDRGVGRRLATATLDELLDRLAHILETNYRAFKVRYERCESGGRTP